MSKAEIKKVFETIKNNGIEFINFRFTDFKGKWLQITHGAGSVNEATFKDGVMFDGSSVAGWKEINESDMVLIPCAKTAFIDPFSAIPTLCISCDVYEPRTGKGYDRDPRNTALLAEEYLKSTGIGDTAYFGPEPEFFVFDDVRFSGGKGDECFYRINSEESPWSSSKQYDGGNYAHRSQTKGAYFDIAPNDVGSDIRSEIMAVMKQVGLGTTLHHHEVAPSQYEIGFEYSTLAKTADNTQLFKYIVKNITQSYGKTATFMPKPVFGDNGSGMHVHQSIWKGGKPLFVGNEYDGLSEMAIYYIGGIIKHVRSLNAFTNPGTNSYKRLVPGFEAPVLLAYSACNRSAAIRLPHVTNKKAKRIETRFPDPAANPYLCFSALLMAGLDGIKNKIHPGHADDRDLYALSEKELKGIPTVCSSLRQALEALDNDRDYLLQGNVFTNEQIDAYISLKMQEVERFEQIPHPAEFDMYYGC